MSAEQCGAVAQALSEPGSGSGSVSIPVPGPERSSGTAVAEEDMIAEIMSEFSQAFASARMRWTRYAEEVHPELKGAGMLVLQSILRKGPVTATELSHLLGMDKAVVSRQVSKLRELGLADAVAAAEDRRVVLLTASDAARAAVDELHAHTSRDYQERFRDWDAVELEALRAALHRFNSSAPMGGSTPASRCARPSA